MEGYHNYYQIDLSHNPNYDYTKGETVMIVVQSVTYPEAKEIEDKLKETNSRFRHLYVCNIVEIAGNEMKDIIPYADEIIDLDE